jgi:NhaP-type Na+/H+ or K+/H+ antiporter
VLFFLLLLVLLIPAIADSHPVLAGVLAVLALGLAIHYHHQQRRRF